MRKDGELLDEAGTTREFEARADKFNEDMLQLLQSLMVIGSPAGRIL